MPMVPSDVKNLKVLISNRIKITYEKSNLLILSFYNCRNSINIIIRRFSLSVNLLQDRRCFT